MTRKRKWIWIVTAVLGAVLCLICLSLAIFWWLLTSPPSYWKPVDANDPAVQQQAAKVESFVTTQTTQVRSAEETWTLTLSTAQVNDWLGARLPMWLANQGVAAEVIQALPNAMVKTDVDVLELAVQARFTGVHQIIRALYKPEGGDPSRLKLQGLYAGGIPLPLGTLCSQVSRAVGGKVSATEIEGWIQTVRLELPLGDRRVVRIVDIQLNDQGAVLTCITSRKPK